DEHVRTCRRPAGLGEPDPEIPVGQLEKLGVETADLPHELGSSDHVRSARRHDVLVEELKPKLTGGRGRLRRYVVALVGDLNDRAVYEARVGERGGRELQPQL